MSQTIIQRGMHLRLRPFEEPAEVLHFEPQGDRLLLVLRFVPSGRAESLVLSQEELVSRIEILPTPPQDFLSRALKSREPFLLYLDALRFSLAYAFDPHYAVSVTQVDLLPHQVEAVYQHILPLPKVRFLLAVALIIPPEAVEALPKLKKERAGDEEQKRKIEEAGMEKALKHEREAGREPQDVSKEFLGYDILSRGAGETRYIEVKAFATTGPLELTPHEWQMARRLGSNYWIYAVEDVLSEPRLTEIQDPVSTLP